MEAIPSLHPIITPNLFHAQRSGKTTVPVKPILSVYAQFKHITGVPSRREGEQIPFSRLKALDNLIDRLVNISADEKRLSIKAQEVSGEIQSLKERYRNMPAVVRPFWGSFLPEAGALVDLVA